MDQVIEFGKKYAGWIAGAVVGGIVAVVVDNRVKHTEYVKMLDEAFDNGVDAAIEVVAESE